MPPASKPLIYNYELAGPQSEAILQNALKLLKPNLPVSIPLYRRLQFGHFLDATRLLTNISLESDSHGGPPNSPWLIAFVDRSCRPLTEVWVFGSWEVVSPSDVSEEESGTIGRILRNLITMVKALEVPISIHQDVLDALVEAQKHDEDKEKDHAGLSRKDYAGHAVDPDIMLWGAVHDRTVAMMEQLGLLSFRFKKSLVPNLTFIWNVDTLPQAKPLPQGLRWGELKKEHFGLVRSRTPIPRQDRTLSILPNLGIFPKESDSPISWAFVGLDASLTTLHVETEWRGKGLAKAVTTKLFKEKMDMFWEADMPKLAHGT